MIDANSRSARCLATLAILIAAACTCTMNWHFGQSLGATEVERHVYSTFGVALDVAKVFGLAFAAHAWEKRRRAKALACVVVWVFAVAYSFAAGMGFAALTRDTV